MSDPASLQLAALPEPSDFPDDARAPQEEEALTLNQVAALARMRMAAARREIEEAELLEKAEALKAEAARKALVGAASALDSAAPAQPTQAQATLPVDPPKKRGVRGARKHLLPASGYHGVIKKSPMCFQAKTSFQSQLVFIGSFSSAEAAARAYDTCMRGLEASRSLAMPATQYNFPSDDVAGHAVAEAEKLMKQQLASMRARFEQGTQGDGGNEDGDGEGGMTKQRRMSAPSTKACTTCGAEMLRRMRVCRACREVAATACTMRGVRTKLKPDGETRYQAFFWHEGENKYLGSFHTEVEAAQCYDERVRAILGNALGDVRLNFASPQEAQAAVDKALEGVDVSQRKKIAKRRRAWGGAAGSEGEEEGDYGKRKRKARSSGGGGDAGGAHLQLWADEPVGPPLLEGLPSLAELPTASVPLLLMPPPSEAPAAPYLSVFDSLGL